MARVLAIDYGMRRTGIAVTDPSQIIAQGLATVETKVLLSYLTKYFQSEQVERVVLGLPKQTNGLDSENLPRVQAFADKFQSLFPSIPIEWWDERYTSVLAHQAMLTGGLHKKARQNKALVDTIAATIILQGWMERRREL